MTFPRTIISFALMLLAGFTGSGQAADYTVKSSGPATATQFLTFADALTAANANPGADTITILDSVTYTSGVALDNTGPLTLLAASGQTPVIESTAATGRVVTLSQPTIIRGASPTARITFRHVNSTAPVLNLGAASTTHSMQLENVIIDKGNSAGNVAINVNNLATSHTLRNVSFVGGLVTAGVINFSPAASGVTLNLIGCDLSAGGTAPRLLIQTTLIAGAVHTINASSTTISPASGSNATAVQCAGAVRATYNLSNCIFRSGTTRLIESNLGIVDSTMTLTNPTLAGQCGDIMLNLESGNNSVSVSGASPANKLSLDGMFNAGTVLFARLRSGRLALTDVQASVRPTAGFIDSAVGPLVSDIALNFERCLFTNGSGNYYPGATGGAFGIAVTGVNSVWGGNPAQPNQLSTSGDHTGVSSITLTHCTMFGGNNVAIDARTRADNTTQTRADVLTANYCIFSDIGGQAASGSVPLLGTRNISTSQGAYGGGGFVLGEPVDTIVGNPSLNGQGIPVGGGIAYNAAVGSSTAIDLLGNPRGGAVAPSIGAYEIGEAVNAARNWVLMN